MKLLSVIRNPKYWTMAWNKASPPAWIQGPCSEPRSSSSLITRGTKNHNGKTDNVIISKLNNQSKKWHKKLKDKAGKMLFEYISNTVSELRIYNKLLWINKTQANLQ